MAGAVSIALATCNGERFLPEFLNSLCAQGRLPQELVACDDASSDDTLPILEGFSERSPFPLRIFYNTTRVGVVENFSKAVSRCTGEWIALADQDDVWREDKLIRLLEAVERPGVMAAFSNADLVGPDLERLGYTVWQQVGLSEGWRKQFDRDRPLKVLFREPVVTGATLMFRRDLLPAILPIPHSWVHDGWISQIAASQGKIVAVPESLILYRQHGGNLIGSRKLSTAQQIRRARKIGRLGIIERESRRYTDLLDRLNGFPETRRTRQMEALCRRKLAHLQRREALPKNRLLRVPTVLAELLNGNYRDFSKDWRRPAVDLLFP